MMSDRSAIQQNQISDCPDLPWIQTSLDLRGSMHRIHEADQVVQEQTESAHSQLQDVESEWGLDELITIIADCTVSDLDSLLIMKQ